MLLCGRGRVRKGGVRGSFRERERERGDEGEGSSVEEIQLFVLSQLLLLFHSMQALFPSLPLPRTLTHTLTGRSTQCNIVLPHVWKMKESIPHSCYQIGVGRTRCVSKRGSHGQIRQNLFSHDILLFNFCSSFLSCCFFSFWVPFSACLMVLFPSVTFSASSPRVCLVFSFDLSVCGCHVLFSHVTSDLVNSRSKQLCAWMGVVHVPLWAALGDSLDVV